MTPKVKWLFEHHYRDFIDFVTGAVYTVKKGTARFLETENQTEMLDLIRIRAMGDFIEEALVGSQKMENRKKIARLKKDIEVKESDKVEGYEYRQDPLRIQISVTAEKKERKMGT